jgi:hypothetical protein
LDSREGEWDCGSDGKGFGAYKVLFVVIVVWRGRVFVFVFVFICSVDGDNLSETFCDVGDRGEEGSFPSGDFRCRM